MNIERQNRSSKSLYDPLWEALATNAMTANVRETNTQQAAYMVQGICQVRNQSRVRVHVRSVWGRFIKQCHGHEKNSCKGNKCKSGAHTINVCYNHTSILRIDEALIPQLGIDAKNKKILAI
jgi:hypothetical protein